MTSLYLETFIGGKVIPKARPRMTKRGHVYTPKDSKDYESYLKWKLQQAYKGKVLDEPLGVEIIFHRTPPNSWSIKKKKEAQQGYIHPYTRPDLDNKIKQVLDAMNGIIYKDDARVVHLTAYKAYAEMDGVYIRVESFKDVVL